MKPENIPSRKLLLPGEPGYSFDSSLSPRARVSEEAQHWMSSHADIRINHDVASNASVSSDTEHDRHSIRRSNADSEGAGSDCRLEKNRSALTPSSPEPREVLESLGVAISVRQGIYPVKNRYVWAAIPFGDLPQTHFYSKGGQIAIAMDMTAQNLKLEKATGLLDAAKTALQYKGYPEANNASTMLELTEKPGGGASIELILHSDMEDLRAAKRQQNSIPFIEDVARTKHTPSDGETPEKNFTSDPLLQEQDHLTPNENKEEDTGSLPSSALTNSATAVEDAVEAQAIPGINGRASVKDILTSVFVQATTQPSHDQDCLYPTNTPLVDLPEEAAKKVHALRDRFGGKKVDAPMELLVDGESCGKISGGVWPSNEPVAPPPPTNVRIKVTCNGFKFNERMVYFNEVSDNRQTGVKIEAYYDQRMHLDLIRDHAGRPDRPLIASIREETTGNKVTRHLEALEIFKDGEEEFNLTQY